MSIYICSSASGPLPLPCQCQWCPPTPPCGLRVGGQQFASANLILDLWSPLTPSVGCGYGDGTVPILFDGRTKPCITPCEPCPASECWICLHRGAPDTHQTVSDKPPDWFCFDFLKEYKESGGLAQPSLDRHSIGRGWACVTGHWNIYLMVPFAKEQLPAVEP